MVFVFAPKNVLQKSFEISNKKVNLQEPSDGLKTIDWDFENLKNWQVLLNEDSVVDFEKRSETPDQLRSANISFCARYLDMPISWVKQFSVTNAGKLLSVET